jgi:hypothetical protein
MSRFAHSPSLSVRSVVTMATAALLLAGGAVASPAAHAAVIDGAVTEITVTPTNPRPSDAIRTTIDWCVPDGTQAGDTFTIVMPEQLGGFPPGFPLTDPTGELVATATIGGNPVTATFTMTDYAETRIGVCGDAFFESRLTASNVANTTQTLVYLVNGTTRFERVIEVSGAGGPRRGQGVKRGEFTDPSDQCRTDTTNCLEWVLTSRVGPYDTVSFVDVAADGLSFSCDSLSLLYWTVNPDGTRGSSSTPGAVGATATIDCTSGRVSVETGPVPADMLVRLRIPSTPDEPTPGGGRVYANDASIGHSGPGGTTTDNVSVEARSALAGGSGVGIGIDIEKYDTDGNDADTADDAVTLPTGETGLVFTITNTSSGALVDVVVTDVVTVGDATVSDLSCDFSTAAAGAPTSGTTWDGPFPPGTQFDCTATLTGVEPGADHVNVASVSGVGAASGVTVSDDDPYHANRSSGSGTPTTTTTTTTTTSSTTTTTSPGGTTSTTVSQFAVPTTTIRRTLPVTGSAQSIQAGIALALLAVGTVLTAVVARRRPADHR